jgi:hypothetical protein
MGVGLEPILSVEIISSARDPPSLVHHFPITIDIIYTFVSLIILNGGRPRTKRFSKTCSRNIASHGRHKHEQSFSSQPFDGKGTKSDFYNHIYHLQLISGSFFSVFIIHFHHCLEHYRFIVIVIIIS